MIAHQWVMSGRTTSSGKMLYHCPRCGLYDPEPVKGECEQRPCEPNRYAVDVRLRTGEAELGAQFLTVAYQGELISREQAFDAFRYYMERGVTRVGSENRNGE